MALLASPPEVVELILVKLIKDVGYEGVLALRTVHSFFDKSIVKLVLNNHDNNTSYEAWTISQKRPFFIKLVRRNLESDTNNQSTFGSLVHKSINTFLSTEPTGFTSAKEQRNSLVDTLLETTSRFNFDVNKPFVIPFPLPDPAKEPKEQPPKIKIMFDDPAVHGAVLLSIATSSLPSLRKLLSFGADPSSTCTFFNSTLEVASQKGDYEAVEILLSQGYGKKGRQLAYWALYDAALNGYECIVKLILDNKYYPKYGDGSGREEGAEGMRVENALKGAIKGGNVRVIELLRSKQAELEERSLRRQLVSAVKRNDVWYLRELCASGVDLRLIDVEVKEEQGCGLLDFAVKSGSYGVVEILLGFKVGNVKGDAICEAAKMGNVDVADLLLENGADIERCSSENGKTALWHAVAYQEDSAVEFLLRKGANVDELGGSLRAQAFEAAARWLRLMA